MKTKLVQTIVAAAVMALLPGCGCLKRFSIIPRADVAQLEVPGGSLEAVWEFYQCPSEEDRRLLGQIKGLVADAYKEYTAGSITESQFNARTLAAQKAIGVLALSLEPVEGPQAADVPSRNEARAALRGVVDEFRPQE